METSVKTLVKGYLEKAEKKLGVAKRLLKSGDYDDVVSRAYYAVFHAAQGLLLTEGEKAESHKGVVTLFGLLFVKTGKFSKDAGKFLANLKDNRERGDYEVFSYIEKDTAVTAVKEAAAFLREAKGYLKKIGIIR